MMEEANKLMNSQKKLIVFGEDWGRFPSSTQYLVRELLRLGWKVIWINSIGMQKPRFTWHYCRRLANKIHQYVRGKTRSKQDDMGSGITVIHPLIIPFIGYSWIDKINCFILKKQMSKALKHNNFTLPVIWMTLPTAYPYYTLFNHSPLVYYCCDDYQALASGSQSVINPLENKLIEHASLIVVVSLMLSTKMPPDKTFVLDHGIDLRLFLKDYARPQDLPKGKPIAGFYGLIGHWVDLHLLYHCALKLQNINFVLIGPTDIDLERLKTLANVYYLGSKSYTEIPAYSQHWNVGIIPFVKNQLTKALNPLKIKEYLAGGHPVVSVDLPSLRDYEAYIYLAKEEDDFVDALALVVENKGEAKKKYDIQNHGWASRALVVEGKLMELLR